MDQAAPADETDAARQARVARERRIIAAGQAQLDAGAGIEDHALETWLDALERDPSAALPGAATSQRS